MAHKWVELKDHKGEEILKCIYCKDYYSSLYYVTERSVEQVVLDKEHETAMCLSCCGIEPWDAVGITLHVDGKLSAMLDYIIVGATINREAWEKKSGEVDLWGPKGEFPNGEFGNEETRYSRTPYNNIPPDHWSIN